MPVIEMVTHINANIQKVFEFHLDLNNLLKITPPEAKLQIFHMPEKIEVGAKVGLFVKIGPVTTTMETIVDEIEAPTKFVDRQISGFFSKWIHTHQFHKVTEKMTRLTDIIDFSLPMGILGNIVGGGVAQSQIEKMFRHRAEMTKTLLEEQ